MHQRRRAASVLVTVTVLAGTLALLTGVASSAGGVVDTTFNTSGARIVDVDDNDALTDLVLQSDGSSIFLTDTLAGFSVTKLTTVGALDTTFGSGGSLASTAMALATGVAVQSSGKVVVVGRTTASGGNLVIARYSTTGTLDTTFGTSGLVTVTMSGTQSGGGDVLVLSDDKLVVLAGDAGNLVLLRYSAEGVLDTSFGTSGVWDTGLDSGAIVRLAKDTDGKLVASGAVGGAGGAARVAANGSIDGSFGTGGVATTATQVVNALALASDNKVVTAGDLGASGTTVTVVRRLTTGALDTTFDGDGLASFSVPGLSDPSGRAIAIASDGKILVAGRQDDAAASSVIFLARLTTAGVLDTTFATGGIATFTTAGSQGTSSAAALAIDGNGRAVVGGAVVESGSSTATDAMVMRVTTADGQTTTTSTASTTTTLVTQNGGTARTDAANAVPSATNELLVSLTTPVGGSVMLAKHDGTAVTGYEPLTGVDITAPSATTGDPLQITLSMYAGLIDDGYPVGSIVVLKDGTPVLDCTAASSATPDPCIASRAKSGAAITFTMRSSTASDWTLAVDRLQRIAGDDRILSAIGASKSQFTDTSAGAVVLARADGFADALAATPLAVSLDAPLLLTGQSSLDDRVLAEIVRVLPSDGTVYLLGGTGALSTSIETRLTSWHFDSIRYAGANRFETARVVAEDGMDSPSTVIETTGLSFADALTAGSAAAQLGAAVLLTDGATQSAATAAYLTDRNPTRYAIGGPAAEADPDATRIAGTDRYETAVLVAMEFFDEPAILGFASGAAFPDALAGGTHAAHGGAPLLLVPTTGDLPVPLTIYLSQVESDEPSAFLYGGTGAVDATVETLLEAALGG